MPATALVLEAVYLGKRAFTDRETGERGAVGKIAVPKSEDDTDVINVKNWPVAGKQKLFGAVRVEVEAKPWTFTDRKTGEAKAGITYTFRSFVGAAGSAAASA